MQFARPNQPPIKPRTADELRARAAARRAAKSQPACELSEAEEEAAWQRIEAMRPPITAPDDDAEYWAFVMSQESEAQAFLQ